MHRFLIDVNLPRRYSLWAAEAFEFVHDLGPTWNDRQIWDYALANDLVVVSKDADFVDRAIIEPAGPRIVQIRFGNARLRQWHADLISLWPGIVAALEHYRIVLVYRDQLDCIA